MEEINIDRIRFNGDKARLILPDGYEFEAEGNKVFVIKKKQNYCNMETKTLEIEVPNGHEIVFKWNKNYNGVEIKADGEHFMLDANPSYYMNWSGAMQFYRNNPSWEIPTTKQLKVVYKYFDKINEIIEQNNGYKLHGGWYWGVEEHGEFCAWYISMNSGSTSYHYKGNLNYVRAVSHLIDD